jgi:hypothetical protein
MRDEALDSAERRAPAPRGGGAQGGGSAAGLLGEAAPGADGIETPAAVLREGVHGARGDAEETASDSEPGSEVRDPARSARAPAGASRRRRGRQEHAPQRLAAA